MKQTEPGEGMMVGRFGYRKIKRPDYKVVYATMVSKSCCGSCGWDGRLTMSQGFHLLGDL